MTDVFQEPEITSAVETLQIVNEPGKSAFDQLVGSDRKFKTQEDLAHAAIEKDRFIEQLKRETKGLREELDRALKDKNTDKRLEEIMTRLNQPTAQPSTEVTTPLERTATAPTQEDVAEIVRKALANEFETRSAQENANKVIQQLKSAFGDNYATRLEQRTQELGLSKAEMNALAARSPQAFMELVNPGKAQVRHQEPPRSGLNTLSQPQDTGEKTYSSFEKMRTSSDPNERARYWSPQIQLEIHQLGEKALREGDPNRFFR